MGQTVSSVSQTGVLSQSDCVLSQPESNVSQSECWFSHSEGGKFIQSAKW